jgi:5-(carboxyamino)imidazole ribonucleotide synthase
VKRDPILPGATLGVLGSGQLGRMFAMAARRLGYRVHTFSPDSDTPTGQVADVEITAAYDDLDAVARFAREVDVVTFEFENVPVAAADAAAALVAVRPSRRALEVCQHRIREKTFLVERGLPVAPFEPVRTDKELDEAVRRIGRPSVLKSASLGYDGKGQVLLTRDGNPRDAWAALGGRESILEAFVDLECELSVIGARGTDGSSAFFGPIENVHARHILDVSAVPATIDPAVGAQATAVAHAVLDALDYVGVLCIEFFLSRQGRLTINELAPRPHNSGHLTIDACETSQFEQQVRAICGLPLGSFDLVRHAAMANLLGDLWQAREPDWAAALRVPGVRLHLYGKTAARPGRKMGHLTALAPSAADARSAVLRARAALTAV